MLKLNLSHTSNEVILNKNRHILSQNKNQSFSPSKVKRYEPFTRCNSYSLENKKNNSIAHPEDSISPKQYKKKSLKTELDKRSINLPLINLQIHKKEQIYRRIVKIQNKFSGLSRKGLLNLSQRHKRNILKPSLEDHHYPYCFKTYEGSRLYNEDRISIESLQIGDKKYQYFAIFDGHGGNTISEYLANYFHIYLKEALESNILPFQALKQTVLKVQEKIKKNFKMIIKGGSCALIALILDKECWVSNIGDSRMISIDANNDLEQVTNDHKPVNELERKRIQDNGGRVCRIKSQDLISGKVYPFRVYPGGLSVSRTIGDFQIKKRNSNLIISEPELHYLNLSKMKKLLIFTDGIYEKMSNKLISTFFLSPQASEIGLNELFKAAQGLKSEDNRSFILIDIL